MGDRACDQLNAVPIEEKGYAADQVLPVTDGCALEISADCL